MLQAVSTVKMLLSQFRSDDKFPTACCQSVEPEASQLFQGKEGHPVVFQDQQQCQQLTWRRALQKYRRRLRESDGGDRLCSQKSAAAPCPSATDNIITKQTSSTRLSREVQF